MIKNGEIVRIEPGTRFTSQVSGHRYEVTAVEVLYGVLSPEISVGITMRIDEGEERHFTAQVIADALHKGGLELVRN